MCNENNSKEKIDVQVNALKSTKETKIKKWPIIKWSIALLLVVAGIIFVGVNNDLCYNTFETPKPKGKEVVYLNSNSVCEQKFKGYDGTLKTMRIYMDNQGREDSEGVIELQIKDESGTVIGSTKKKLSSIRTRRFSNFQFKEQPKLDKDETYTLVLKCVEAYNPQKFGVYTSVDKKGWLSEANIDGSEVEENRVLRIRMVFRYYDTKSMTLMIAMMVLALIIILIPFELVSSVIEKKFSRKIPIDKYMSRVLFAAAPFIAYFIMESLSGFSIKEIIGFIFLPKGIFNLALYAVILLVLYAVTNKTQYAAVLLWGITLIFGLTNYFVFSFRGIPVLAADLLSVGTALNVADSFEYTYDICVLWAVSIFAAFSAIMFSLKPYKGFKLKKRIGVVVTTIVVIVLANYVYIGSDIISSFGIEDSQWKPQLTYAKNGSMLSFITSWKYIKTEKPEGYSIDSVKDVTDKFKSDDTDKMAAKSKKMPNVIAIMNESLADLSVDGTFETSEDYLPFIRSLTENTVKGQLYVSIEGANTANSEFEFLTGNTLAFFAPRAVPYNNYVKGVVPSLTRTLAAQGYVGNNSYHPYKRSGWNRENVYNSLGFNHFYSDEYYKDATFIRNFISDESTMEQIIADYEAAKKESDDPFYLFNVTVQNHGGYVGNRGFVEATIKPTNSKLESDEVNQYLTLAKQSDEAFEKLIDYFETVDEPTVIVMFGDHQPPLSTEFYTTLFGKEMDEFTAEDTAKWYSTPYVIWANYDIEEKQDFNMSANYLSSYMLKLIDADLTGYNKYLLELQEKLPVITGLFYAGDDGKFHDIDEKSQYTELIEEYAKVQYNGLFDKDNRINEFFFLEGGDYEVEETE